MMRFAALKDSVEKALKDESKPWAKHLAMAEQKTGLDRIYIFLGLVAITAVYLVCGIGQQLVSNIFGSIYPAYGSMKALESPKKDDDTKWLTYWVVFSVFASVEFFVEYIVCYFPFYWLFKCIFYMWLMAPMDYNGSLILYHRFIRPLFLKYETRLDKLLSSARNAAVRITVDALTNKKDE